MYINYKLNLIDLILFKFLELLGYVTKITEQQNHQSPTKADKVLTKRQVELKNIKGEAVIIPEIFTKL